MTPRRTNEASFLKIIPVEDAAVSYEPKKGTDFRSGFHIPDFSPNFLSR
jgi:hypothetical protein